MTEAGRRGSGDELERRTLPEPGEIGVRGSCRLIEPAGHQVPVGVESHSNGRVPHDDAKRLRVHARRDEQRRASVPRLVQSDRREQPDTRRVVRLLDAPGRSRPMSSSSAPTRPCIYPRINGTDCQCSKMTWRVRVLTPFRLIEFMRLGVPLGPRHQTTVSRRDRLGGLVHEYAWTA